MEIDIKTVVLFYFIANALNNGLIFIIWRMYRTYYRGLSFLLIDMCLQTIGSLFFLLRGTIPEPLSIIVTNLFSITGLWFILKGLERFYNVEKPRVYNYFFMAVYMLLVVYFTFIDNNLLARNICISLMIILFNCQSGLLLLRKAGPDFRRISRFTAGILLAYCVFNVGRITALIFVPQQNNEFFHSGIVNSVSMITYSSLNILIAAGFIMLVSRRLLNEVQTEKEKYTTAFHSSPYAILLTRITDGTIFEVNDEFVGISGYQPQEVIGKTTIDVGLWADADDRFSFIHDIQSGVQVRHREVKFRIKNGDIITGLLSSQKISAYGEDCILTSVSDITEMNKIKEKLEEMALHDTLTGLPNRQLFYDRAGIALANAKRDKNKIAVISLDVDCLKSINDRWGHAIGDQVLVAVSRRLTSLLRRGDTVSRFGGDEFVLLLCGINRAEDAIIIVRKISECVAEALEIEGNSIRVTLSMGIAIFPDDGFEMEGLIRKSDDAMYSVKTHGRNGFRFYNDNV